MMSKVAWSLLAIFFVLSLTNARLVQATTVLDSTRRTAYVPLADDPSTLEARFARLRPKFVKAWNGDACAQGEPLEDYVDHWIHDFYVEGAGGYGWLAESALIESKLPSSSSRATITNRLDSLGARIAIEWAKPNDCRKISTFGGPPSIMAYSSVLAPFLQAPAPLNVHELNAALRSIESSVDEALQ